MTNPFLACIFGFTFCHNLNLGLTTKVKACRDANEEGNQGSHLMFLGVQKSVRE